MKIRDILSVKGSQVYSVGLDETLEKALSLLVSLSVGALLVRDAQEAVAGIISERDVLRECLQGRQSLRELRVRDAMTVDLLIGVPDDDVEYIMGVMTQNRVRHLPILEGERMVGIISIGDVVKACLEESRYENRYLKEYIQTR